MDKDRIIIRRRTFLKGLVALPFASQAMVVGEVPAEPEGMWGMASPMVADMPTMSIGGGRFELLDLQINYATQEPRDVIAMSDERSFREAISGRTECTVRAEWLWSEEADRVTRRIFESGEQQDLFLWIPKTRSSFEGPAVMTQYTNGAMVAAGVRQTVVAEFLCVVPPTWTWFDESENLIAGAEPPRPFPSLEQNMVWPRGRRITIR